MVDFIRAFVRSSEGHCNCTYFMLYIHALSSDEQKGRNRMDTHKKRIEQNIISRPIDQGVFKYSFNIFTFIKNIIIMNKTWYVY